MNEINDLEGAVLILNREIKNRQISKTWWRTVDRHKSMVCKTYELKADRSHLSDETLETLRRLFLEAKWFYNHLIAQGDVFHADYKIKVVRVRNKKGEFEERELHCLSSQMRQEIIDRTKDTVISRLHPSHYSFLRQLLLSKGFSTLSRQRHGLGRPSSNKVGTPPHSSGRLSPRTALSLP
jgi:putative transposase